MVLDAVAFDEGDDVGGGVASERRLGEVGIRGEEVVGAGVEVGEVTAASAGDENLLADSVGVLEKDDAAATLGGFDGEHETGCACSYDEDVGDWVGGWSHRTQKQHTTALLEYSVVAC